MGGSTTTTTNSTTDNAPWAPAQPYYLQAMQDQQNVFEQNQPNLQNMSDQIYGAYSPLAQTAFAPSHYTLNAQNMAQGIGNGFFLGANPGANTEFGISQGGYNPATTPLSAQAAGGLNPASASLSALAGGGGALGSLAAFGGAASPSANYYGQVLGGQYLNSNPYINAMAQQGTDAATKAVNARYAATGMGAGLSTPYASALATGVADASNSLRYGAYNDGISQMNNAAGQADAATNAANQIRLGAANDQAQNQIAAAGALGSQYLQGQQDQTSAASALGSQYLQGQQNQLGAATQADAAQNAQVNQMLAALGLAPGLASAQYAGVSPALSMLSEAASIPYTGIGAYSGQLSGLTKGYGTSTTNGTQTVDEDPGMALTGLANTALAGWSKNWGAV
jgi:hypothetical protein